MERLWRDLKVDQSAAVMMGFQRFLAWHSVERKAQTVGMNHGLDGD